MAKEGTMQYYNDIDDYNKKLSAKLLKNTIKKPSETSTDWLRRVSLLHSQRRK